MTPLVKILLRALMLGPRTEKGPTASPGSLEEVGEALAREARARLGRSLCLREVDTGSCNGCELEIQALSNPIYDLERFGIKFVASPRHADVLLVTGPVSRNMETALRRTWDATPNPKWVVAVGACGKDGGPFRDAPEVLNGVANVLPVDLHIAGCPPSPRLLLEGLLALLQATS